jgi:hypothetical protein
LLINRKRCHTDRFAPRLSSALAKKERALISQRARDTLGRKNAAGALLGSRTNRPRLPPSGAKPPAPTPTASQRRCC